MTSLAQFLCLGSVEVANMNRLTTYIPFLEDTCDCAALEMTGYQDIYCLAPRHRILTADLQWVPGGDLVEGDPILAFEEFPTGGRRLRRWQRGEVTRSERATKDCMRVSLSNGDSIECSADHPWLSHTHSSRQVWTRTDSLRVGAAVAKPLDTWTAATSYDDGWLAGMFDGEGCLFIGNATFHISLAQRPGPVLDYVCEVLARHKFDISVRVMVGGCAQVHVRGGFAETVRALGVLRPLRLLHNFQTGEIDKRKLRQGNGDSVRVLEVEWLGSREVQSIATSTGTYVAEGFAMHNSDQYDVYEYISPEVDPAPWYDSNHPESADFLGFVPKSINMSVPTQRNTFEVLDEGSVLGRERRPGRVVEVIGWMIARDARGMYWGERWLNNVLRGQGCQGGCGGDTLTLLPFCRDTGDTICDYSDIFIDTFACSDCLTPPDCDTFGVYQGTHESFEADFRSLLGTALVDGPRWAEVSDDDEYIIQTAQFQLTSKLPWLYSQAITVSEGTLGGGSDCSVVTTDAWTDGEAIAITIQAGPGGAPSPGLSFTMTYTLDGTCPEDRVHASVDIQIPELEPEAGITIDGASHQVIYHNPTSHRDEPGFDRISWADGFCWPNIPACTTMCVCLENSSGPHDVDFSITRRKREL